MTNKHGKMLATTATAMFAAAALAQTSISPNDRFAWSENCGWLNFRDAGTPSGAQGVHVHADFLSGFVWGENIGWINVGGGAGPYANTNGTNFGVNVNTLTGALTGFAWGENVGWINFAGGALATPANAARIDFGAGRFRGYAWGENIGWVNLDDSTHFVGVLCPADVDDGSNTGTPDGGVTIDDLLYYLALFEAGDIDADVDDGSGTGTPDGGVTIDDLIYYLTRFEGGC